YLYSVFSHMETEQVRIYLRDFRRLLASNGRLFFTSFAEEGVPDISVNPKGYRREWSGPLHCVRYRRGFLESLLQSSGFSVNQFDTNVELDNHLEKSGRPTALEDLKALMSAARIMYVRQPSPLGLGDAVLRAAPFVGDEPFGVLLGDDITVDPPCSAVLKAAHERLGGSAIALQQVPRDQIGRYGMAVGKEVEPGIIRLEDL